MQNAKDTFFQMLQARIAALNPARTVLVRGLSRPGVMVTENELLSAAVLIDGFRLEWTGVEVKADGPMSLVTLECAILYATDGTSGAGGMDRGRALAAMDGELLSALSATPRNTPKVTFAESDAGVQATAMATNVSWGDAVFGSCVAKGERLARTVTVPVLFYGEAGEL